MKILPPSPARSIAFLTFMPRFNKPVPWPTITKRASGRSDKTRWTASTRTSWPLSGRIIPILPMSGISAAQPISRRNPVRSRGGLNFCKSTAEPMTSILARSIPFCSTSWRLITDASATILEQPCLKIKARPLLPIGSVMQRARASGIPQK